jgi:hypothetical protein
MRHPTVTAHVAIVGLGLMMTACTNLVPNGYEQVSAAAPTPRPAPFPTKADQRALEPYTASTFHVTGSQ